MNRLKIGVAIFAAWPVEKQQHPGAGFLALNMADRLLTAENMLNNCDHGQHLMDEAKLQCSLCGITSEKAAILNWP